MTWKRSMKMMSWRKRIWWEHLLRSLSQDERARYLSAMPVDCSADNHNTQGNGKFHSGDWRSDYLTKNNLLSVTEISEAEYRVVVLGSEATGKTCLISQLLYDIFPRDLVSTVEEMYRDVSPRAELNAFCSSRVRAHLVKINSHKKPSLRTAS